MSNHVLPPEKAVEKKTHPDNSKKFVWRWVMLIAAALALCLILCTLLLPRVFNLDRVTRYFKYLGVSEGSDYGQIRFDSNSTDSYAIFNGRFAVGCEDGLYLYDDYGEQLALVQGSLPYPKLCTCERMALCYSNESSTLVAMNKKGEALLQTTADGTLLDAELSADGGVCYAATDNGCKTRVTVMDQDLNVIYKWNSYSQYLNCCAVSERADRLAVAGLNQINGVFYSTLTVLRTDSEDDAVLAEAQLGNQVIYELWFLKDDRICAIGESSTLFFDTAGNCLQTFDYEGMTLTDFTAGKNGTLFLAFDRNKPGMESMLVSLNADGSEAAKKDFAGEIQSISTSGKYLAVLTENGLYICTQQLEAYHQTDEYTAANRALARADGTVLLVNNGQTQLYIP